MKKLFFLILIFLLIIPIINAQYYADVKIYINDDGSVDINGKTNFDNLKNITNSHMFTSKEKAIWTLNISFNQTFDNYIYELILPQNSEVTYIKTTPFFRITEEDDKIKLIGTGEDREFSILVQYKLSSTNSITKNREINWMIVISALLIIVGAVVLRNLGFKLKRDINKERNVKDLNLNDKNNNNSDGQDSKEKLQPKFTLSNFPLRQQEIIKLLQKNKTLTQKQLEASMQIPKSSISRNVKTLVLKGIIKKESVGQSNYLSLQVIFE